MNREIIETWADQSIEPDALLVNTSLFSEMIRSLRGFHPYLNRVYNKPYGWEWAGIPIYLTMGIERFQFVNFTKN